MTDYAHEFALDEGIVYLNHAAVAPWPKCTRDAVIRFADENARLGSQNYLSWVGVENELRQRLAQLINAPGADDIALLKNTSEGLSMVAAGIDWQAGDTIISSDEEFPSNRIVWEALADNGVKLKTVSLSCDDPEQALIDQVDDNTRLIAISSVQYASGLRLDLNRLGRFCQQRNILFCVDAIQSIGAVEFDVQACHADFVVADGHKWMLGPEGLALFYVRPERREQLRLSQYGWHMVEEHLNFDNKQWQPAKSARRFECGSPNMLAVHALHASVGLLLSIGMAEVEKRLLENSRYLIQQVLAHDDLVLITRNDASCLAGIVTFRHRHKDNEALYHALMKQGVMCAYRGGGVRFSPHFYTPRSIIDVAVQMVISQGV